jgi:hypothetical protein
MPPLSISRGPSAAALVQVLDTWLELTEIGLRLGFPKGNNVEAVCLR